MCLCDAIDQGVMLTVCGCAGRCGGERWRSWGARGHSSRPPQPLSGPALLTPLVSSALLMHDESHEQHYLCLALTCS